MENKWKLATFILVGFIAGFFASEGITIVRGSALLGAANVKPAAETAKAEDTAAPKTVTPDADDDAFLGDANAPVTIIEFSDFQCPFCNRFFRETLPQIKQKYLDTGKVKFVYRDFPLPKHTEADEAAQAAECAREQGEENYWKMHDAIFLRVDEWAGNPDVKKALHKFANDLRLDAKKFDECLASEKYRDEILKDLKDGINAGVNGTPGFFINGEIVEGAQPFEVFQEVIERKLSNP